MEYAEYQIQAAQGIKMRGRRIGTGLRPENVHPRVWHAYIKYRGRRALQKLPFPSLEEYMRDICRGPRQAGGMGKEIGAAILVKLAEKGFRVAA